jgi:hypothetical protein
MGGKLPLPSRVVSMSRQPTEQEILEKIDQLRTEAARLMYKASLLTEQAAKLEDSFARAIDAEPKQRTGT